MNAKILMIAMALVIGTPEQTFERLVDAFAFVESRYNPAAVNGNCVGYLQISPIMVREVNRLLGDERYTLDDRWDKDKSIEMFRVIMEKKNPTLDVDKACVIWNGKACSRQYKEAIKTKLKETEQL